MGAFLKTSYVPSCMSMTYVITNNITYEIYGKSWTAKPRFVRPA